MEKYKYLVFELSLVRTWFLSLLVCDHSQGVYFPPNTGGGVSFFGYYSNKQKKKNDNSEK